MRNIYIHQHTRLGDMILCNGLIRILSKKNNTSYLNIFCRSKHLKLIQFMYLDHKLIKLIPINEHLKLTDAKLLIKYKEKFIQNYIKKIKLLIKLSIYPVEKLKKLFITDLFKNFLRN